MTTYKFNSVDKSNEFNNRISMKRTSITLNTANVKNLSVSTNAIEFIFNQNKLVCCILRFKARKLILARRNLDTTPNRDKYSKCFFNLCICRIANPYSKEGWDNISQPSILPFSNLMFDISGRTGGSRITIVRRYYSF